MIRKLAHFFTTVMQRWLPDAFLFAVILTLVVVASGMLFEHQSLVQMTLYWGDGLWNLLAFAMQMVFILVTGYVLANTAVVKAALHRIARYGHTPVRAVVITTVVATMASWLNWGFGLVVGALLARAIARRNQQVHFPLLVAAAYSGFLVWHAGLSGSIPLKIASPGHDALSALLGGNAIPVSNTIFSTPVLIIVTALLVSLPILNVLMLPRDAADVEPLDDIEDPPEAIPLAETPAQWLEQSPVISMLLAAMGLIYLYHHFSTGGTLGLNSINLILLSTGLLLHRSPRNYLNALNEAIGSVSGIVLQFPLYAGIMGMMVHSGLAASLSQWFVDISTTDTFPVLTFLSAGVINFFIPSGGGQWAVQAPIVIPAAQSLGVPLSHAAMAVAFGDAWTNMIQPFWALPLLGIAGLSIRQIMGYCTVVLLWSGIIISLGLWWLF